MSDNRLLAGHNRALDWMQFQSIIDYNRWLFQQSCLPRRSDLCERQTLLCSRENQYRHQSETTTTAAAATAASRVRWTTQATLQITQSECHRNKRPTVAGRWAYVYERNSDRNGQKRTQRAAWSNRVSCRDVNVNQAAATAAASFIHRNRDSILPRHSARYMRHSAAW